MRHARTVALCLVALVILLTSVQIVPAVDKIVVGAWNIESLGRPNGSEGSGKGVSQQPADIANYIRSSGVHLLALEEIDAEKNTGNHPTNSILENVVTKLSSDSGASWKYRLFRGPKSKAVIRLTGVMWNETILKPVGDPLPLKVPANSFHGKGKPTAMKFSAGEGKTDIVIVPVHMRSNHRIKVAVAAKKRTLEAKLIVEALGKIREQLADQDIMVVGDVNALKKSETAVQVFVQAGFRDLNKQDLVTYIHKRFHSPLDRAFVPDNQPEFTNSKLEVFELS